jgi:hypothetical protein
MRRIASALFITLLSVSPALAQQPQTPPPTPPTAPPAPTPRVTVTAPRPAVTMETQRTGQAPAPPVVAERSTLNAFARMSPASWQNIKLDVVISDSLVPDLQSKKSVSMLILDGLSGQVRSSAGEGLINIDARPTIRPDGRVWVQLTIEYRPELSGQQLQQAGLNRTALFSESLALLVADGKPVMASQSADPRSDRKVSVEVTATVIK